MADELLKHDFITMIDKKNMNRKLIILNYLSRCGCKVVYNKKKNLNSPSFHIINNKTIIYKKRNRITSNNIFENKNSLDFINPTKDFNYNYNNKSNKKPVTNLKQNLIININNYLNNKEEINKQPYRKSNSINKKIYVKTRSVERENVKKNINSIYKANLTLNNNFNNNNDYQKAMDLLLSEPKNNNKRISRYSELNNNYVNIINEEDELNNERIYDLEIKNLLKERDKEINNIMIRYQNKISKIKLNKNVYLKKRVFTCGSDSKNKPEENYNYNDKVLSCRARIDYSNSSSSLNKITTACEDYKNNEYY